VADCIQAFASFRILGIHIESIPDNYKQTAPAISLSPELSEVASGSLPL
jgi:hypothetical protein